MLCFSSVAFLVKLWLFARLMFSFIGCSFEQCCWVFLYGKYLKYKNRISSYFYSTIRQVHVIVDFVDMPYKLSLSSFLEEGGDAVQLFFNWLFQRPSVRVMLLELCLSSLLPALSLKHAVYPSFSVQEMQTSFLTDPSSV